MKILFIGDIAEKEKKPAPLIVASHLFTSFLERNHETAYFTYFKEGERYGYLRKLFGKEIITSNPLRVRYGIIPLIIQVIKYGPEIIYLTNMDFFYIVLFPLKIFYRFRIIYTVHGLAHYELKYFWTTNRKAVLEMKIMERIIFRYCDKVLFLSEKVKRLASINYKVEKEKIGIVNNGIVLRGTYKRYNSTLNGKALKIAVISAGINRKEKGVDLLLDYLFRYGCQCEINIYGSHNAFHEKIGMIRVINNSYKDAHLLAEDLMGNDIFIAPSRYDSFNIGLLNAMGLGIIVLASDRVGLTERFENHLKSLIYRYNNYYDFHNKLQRVLNMSVEELEFNSFQISEFAKRYNWENVSEAYLEIFNETR